MKKNLESNAANVTDQAVAMKRFDTEDATAVGGRYGGAVVFGSADSDTRALGAKYNDMLHILSLVGTVFGQSIADAAESLGKAREHYHRTDTALAGE
ncbi:hypothetical protein [Amycolatopsis taiwanensis]|uniref:hypothetical protein n=1 Tax=Amycolatopsis taiwanensis TaxID=342230 RepID=UPI002553F6D4|nr:hypothetical protein [Amycolatopsis taiwanensis]